MHLLKDRFLFLHDIEWYRLVVDRMVEFQAVMETEDMFFFSDQYVLLLVLADVESSKDEEIARAMNKHQKLLDDHLLPQGKSEDWNKMRLV